MNEQSPPGAAAPAKASFRGLADCRTLGDAFKTQELIGLIKQAAPKSMDPQAMLRTWIQATGKQPNLMKCDLKQSLGAFMSLAFLGLVPNTHLNQAHILPFRKMLYNPQSRQRDIESWEPQIIIGYPGYIELAHRSGVLKSLHCDVVYDRRLERFSYSHGSNRHLDHYGLPPDFAPKGSPECAYAYARLSDGEEQFEVLNWHEVLGIRNRSNAYRNALHEKEAAEGKGWRVPAGWTEAPWVRDEPEMAKKTACRRLVKWLPKSPELRAAAALEEAQDHGSLDFGPVIEGTANPLDGVPLAAPGAEPPADPGSALTDRRPVPTPGEPPTSANATPPVSFPPQAAFEARLINAHGDSDGTVFRDPVAWARAFADLWETREDGTDAALLEHNADGLVEARGHPDAGRLLDDLDAVVQSVAPQPVTVKPRQERGRVNWPRYVQDIKTALKACPVAQFADWLTAQRAELSAAPMAQRAGVVRAISEDCAGRHLHPPPWLAELLITPGDPDSDWVTQKVAEVREITDRRSYEAFLIQPGLEPMMVRLRAEKPVLFQRADDAFTERHTALPDA